VLSSDPQPTRLTIKHTFANKRVVIMAAPRNSCLLPLWISRDDDRIQWDYLTMTDNLYVMADV
jgi:hypothetical protein